MPRRWSHIFSESTLVKKKLIISTETKRIGVIHSTDRLLSLIQYSLTQSELLACVCLKPLRIYSASGTYRTDPTLSRTKSKSRLKSKLKLKRVFLFDIYWGRKHLHLGLGDQLIFKRQKGVKFISVKNIFFCPLDLKK